MRRLFEIGGYAAAVILLAFGIATLFIGLNGRSEVSEKLKQEKIYGGDDMYPEAIRAAGEESGLPSDVEYPDCSVYDPDKAAADGEYKGEQVDNGESAQCFASYMRIHALESSGGLVYAEMGRFTAANDPENPAGTSDPGGGRQGRGGQPRPERRAQHLGDRDGALDGAQHGLLRRAGLDLQYRRRGRSHSRRHRLRGSGVRGIPQAVPSGERRTGTSSRRRSELREGGANPQY